MADKEYHAAWRAKQGERLKTYQREWKRAHPETAIKTAIRMREYRNTEAGRESARRAVRKYAGIPEPTRPRPAACECCGEIPTRALCADHDHVTWTARGWLCFSCNVGIGLLGDSLAGVLKAVQYLKTYDLR